MTISLPAVIRVLHEKLHFRYWGPHAYNGLDTFLVDLADWKLSLTDRTPCFWLHTPEVLNQPTAALAQAIQDVVWAQKWRNETVLVLVDGHGVDLQKHLANAPATSFFVLDERQQREVVEALSPTPPMLDALLKQLSRSQLAPYEISQPVTGSRFFGREIELRRVLKHQDNNYLVIGIRRIGKSSFLREIERRLDLSDPPKNGKQRRLYVDCSVITTPEEFFSEIIGGLNQQALKFFHGRPDQSRRFQAKMFDYLAEQQGGPITYLLDEIDRLIERLQPDLSMFDALRKASMQGKSSPARFIMAGSRAAQQARNNLDTPFYHFAEEILLQALDRKDAREMIEVPMERLRVKFDDREQIVQRIYRETAGMPNLIQYYCHALVRQVDEDEGIHTLTPANLTTVYENASFRDFVLQTFLANARPLERAIIFAMVGRYPDQKSFSQHEIEAELAHREMEVNFKELDDAFNALVMANVLDRKGREHTFCIPLFPEFLKNSYRPDYGFRKARQEFRTASEVM